MTTYSTINKNATTYSTVSVSLDEDLLLMESGDFLLLEVGDQIILEQSVPAKTSYTTISKNVTTYSTVGKN